MNQPKVSIVVPCYNVAPYIDRCVASIKAQTLSDYEVLFINDGSTDDTLTRLEQYADERRFRIFSFPNQGVAAARNEGIERARGEYLYFCDPDDEMMPTLLETAVGRLDSTNADAVHFSYRAVSAVTGEEQAAYTGNRLTVNECYSGGGKSQRSLCLASSGSPWATCGGSAVPTSTTARSGQPHGGLCSAAPRSWRAACASPWA